MNSIDRLGVSRDEESSCFDRAAKVTLWVGTAATTAVVGSVALGSVATFFGMLSRALQEGSSVSFVKKFPFKWAELMGVVAPQVVVGVVGVSSATFVAVATYERVLSCLRNVMKEYS